MHRSRSWGVKHRRRNRSPRRASRASTREICTRSIPTPWIKVPKALRTASAVGEQTLPVPEEIAACVRDDVDVRGHDDRLLRAGLDAEAAVDAAKEVDLEDRRIALPI